ncbi:Actin/actin-like protein [Neoconidiobolus thromboides FSU 785]|nr:Actin/actin-like protein [Neoconidiobolus thromboides FSU 785]
MEYEEVLTNQPIVIDNGSGVIKSGFAGATSPKSYFPSIVGHPKHTRVLAGGVEGDTFIGKRAEELRGLLKLSYPIEHGTINNWDDMETIWRHLYSQELDVSSEEHPVLLTEAPFSPTQMRDRAAQIFFETFNVPSFLTSVQAILSLYASGRTTGIVLDCGDGVTHAVPIYEGFSMPNAVKRVDIAGRDVTEYLQVLLRKGGYNFHTSAEKEIVRLIKEKTCYVSSSPNKEAKETSGKVSDFLLPDGQIIKLGSERYRAAEILFNPEIYGLEYSGLPQVIVDSISKVDLDLRADLYKNIVLSGGSTLFKGFGERMLQDIRKLAPKDLKIKITAPPERKFTTWIGGSILASLSTFKKMMVTIDEYREDPRIIHTRSIC